MTALLTVVIGMAGEPARMILRNVLPDDVLAQIEPGEVAIEVADSVSGPLRISADGLRVEADDAQAAAWDAVMLRHRRVGLLQASDWTQGIDVALSETQRAAWQDYRQALRDIPQDQPDATTETVIWPDAPQG